MKLTFGIRAHDVKKDTDIDTLLDEVNALGIENIQLVIPKALKICNYSTGNIKVIKESISVHNVNVSMLGAYFNPVHSNIDVVNAGISNFLSNINIASELGCKYVGSETGSYNDHPWTFVPKNHTEKAFNQTRNVFAELVKQAELKDVCVLVEPAWAHVIYDVPTAERFVKSFNSTHIQVTIDLFNLLYAGNFEKRNEIFEEALSTFKDSVKIIHLKDGKIENGKKVQLPPGRGDFDYPFMLACIKKYCPNAVLTFEGVSAKDIPFSLKYLNKF